jgi:hypothetical protein
MQKILCLRHFFSWSCVLLHKYSRILLCCIIINGEVIFYTSSGAKIGFLNGHKHEQNQLLYSHSISLSLLIILVVVFHINSWIRYIFWIWNTFCLTDMFPLGCWSTQSCNSGVIVCFNLGRKVDWFLYWIVSPLNCLWGAPW